MSAKSKRGWRFNYHFPRAEIDPALVAKHLDTTLAILRGEGPRDAGAVPQSPAASPLAKFATARNQSTRAGAQVLSPAKPAGRGAKSAGRQDGGGSVANRRGSFAKSKSQMGNFKSQNGGKPL